MNPPRVLPYATQKLRQLTHESDMTYRTLAAKSGIPIDRIHTLARGNAAMRISEAATLAGIFDRSVSVFAEQDVTNDRRIYASKHKEEIGTFQELIIACQELQKSFRTHPYDRKSFEAVPKDAYYDDTISPASKIAQRESLYADTVFRNTHSLWKRNSILLAGSQEPVIRVMTVFMQRWWKKVTAQQIVKVYFEMEETERKAYDIYHDLLRSFDSIEACQEDPPGSALLKLAELELNGKLQEYGLVGKITSHKQTEAKYYNALTNLKVYEFFHFVQEINQLGAKSNTILGDQLRERIGHLSEIGAIDHSGLRASEGRIDREVFGITPIHAGYGVILNKLSDTELARMVIERQSLRWHFGDRGEILATDKYTVIASSITELAAKMRTLSFFAGEKPNESTGILWQNIPNNERKLIQMLEQTDVII